MFRPSQKDLSISRRKQKECSWGEDGVVVLKAQRTRGRAAQARALAVSAANSVSVYDTAQIPMAQA